MEFESDEVTNLHPNHNKPIPIFSNPFIFFTNLISLQTQIISTSIHSLVSPFLSIISFISGLLFRRRAKEDHHGSEPTKGGLLLSRITVGLAAAAYVFMVLMAAMTLAAVLGVGLVRAWAEEPVYVREGLRFDYVEAHPTAVFDLGNKAVVGHTFHVSLLLLMPDSDYNRDLGIFQLTAELISLEGELVAKSSRPCMLRFWSWPIRLTRTFLMGVPLVLGITTETQMITYPILKHKETRNHPRTEYIRVTLIPRAGTMSLPQFYESEIVVQSRPSWTRGFVHKWKWTFYVWTTLYIFIFLVTLLVFFLEPLVFPVMASPSRKSYEQGYLGSREALAGPRDEREVSESVKRWQRSRSKRKAALLHGVTPESESETESVRSSGATSINITRRDIGSSGFDDGSEDSESVGFRGFE
ncbi:hypothetical protein CASFOL_003601 [Castilleja foliolosa]|uniref:Seipin n=1 Tax=Castilleja foliolosa TaxID=1961234 RepID=A0ABD3ELD8_9LAMI